MVKDFIVYEALDKQFITSLHYTKIAEYLCLETLIRDENTGIIQKDYTELSIDNKGLIALRNYLNSLPLSKRD